MGGRKRVKRERREREIKRGREREDENGALHGRGRNRRWSTGFNSQASSLNVVRDPVLVLRCFKKRFRIEVLETWSRVIQG